jgi:hypothetical protein
VQFGFIRGAALRDPLGLLQGKARYVRHVKLRKVRDIDREALGDFLAQAVRLGGVTRASSDRCAPTNCDSTANCSASRSRTPHRARGASSASARAADPDRPPESSESRQRFDNRQ